MRRDVEVVPGLSAAPTIEGDAAVAAEIGDALPLVPLGNRMLRGLTEAVSVFSVRPADPDLTKLSPAKVLAVQRNARQS